MEARNIKHVLNPTRRFFQMQPTWFFSTRPPMGSKIGIATPISVQGKRRMKRTSASFQGHFDVFLILNEKYLLCCCVQWSSQKALTAWCWWILMVQYSLVIWKRLSLHIVRDWRFPPTWYCHPPERLYTHVWCFTFSLYPHSGWFPSFASTRICLSISPSCDCDQHTFWRKTSLIFARKTSSL